MTITAWTGEGDATDRSSAMAAGHTSRGWRRRGLLLAAVAAGAVWAIYATGATDTAEAMARAGGDFVRLLRFMALLKAMMAVGALVAVWWRLAVPAAPGWLIAYLAAAAAMAAGPVLIWGMVHVGLGALLLHGGLFAALVALWRDPAVAARLGAMVAARRVGLLGPRASRRRIVTQDPLRPCSKSPAHQAPDLADLVTERGQSRSGDHQRITRPDVPTGVASRPRSQFQDLGETG